MKTYVQSCGKSQEHDYFWLEVDDKGDQRSTIPSVLKEIQPEDIVDSQKPSIILARSHKRLILLVTALETRDGRTDFMGRQIRNSVAWVGSEGGDTEKLLRKIAIQALSARGELATDVDAAVINAPDSIYGFTVCPAEFKKIKKTADSLEVRAEAENPISYKGGDNNQRLRDELISDLKKYALSISESSIQIWVVVTTMKSEHGLEAKGVWRGLSSRIESESKDWIRFCVPGREGSDSKTGKKKLTIPLLVVGGLVASVIAVAIWFLSHQSVSQQMQPERIAPVRPNPAEMAPQITPKTSPQ